MNITRFMSLVMPLVTRCFMEKEQAGLATGSAVVSDLLNVALFFESDLHIATHILN